MKTLLLTAASAAFFYAASAQTNDCSVVRLPESPASDSTNATSKLRLLTDSEAAEVRSNGLDPKGMTIEADLPVTRVLTDKEMFHLESQGIDTSSSTGKLWIFFTDQERAALRTLIADAKQAKLPPTPSDLKNAYIWLESFMGETNATMVGDIITMKTDALKFRVGVDDYTYSGHYSVLLKTPRVHKKLWGFGSPDKAKLVILENVGGDTIPLSNATIWEQDKGFINAISDNKEWIHSGRYTIQN